MAQYTSLFNVMSQIRTSLTNAGCNAVWYGTPSQLNEQKARTYPVGSFYTINTSVPSPTNYVRGGVQVNTTFDIYIWFGYPNEMTDTEPNNALAINHSNAQALATDFMSGFYQAIESDNFDIRITETTNSNLTFFEEHGTDRISGCRFSLSVNYYENCA